MKPTVIDPKTMLRAEADFDWRKVGAKFFLPRNHSKINNSYFHDPLVTEKCLLLGCENRPLSQSTQHKGKSLVSRGCEKVRVTQTLIKSYHL